MQKPETLSPQQQDLMQGLKDTPSQVGRMVFGANAGSLGPALAHNTSRQDELTKLIYERYRNSGLEQTGTTFLQYWLGSMPPIQPPTPPVAAGVAQ